MRRAISPAMTARALLMWRERWRVFVQAIIPCLHVNALNPGCKPACCAALLMASLVLLGSPLRAAEPRATLAVAANFMPTATLLARTFEREHGGRVRLSSGSTGKLYAQIINGAPFDVFLAADAARPQLLDEGGQVLAGSRFTYALGRLVLVAQGRAQTDPKQVLHGGKFRRLALANPKLAPYGLASRQALTGLTLWESTRRQRVTAENVGQVWAMFATGNVELAFVALSQLRAPNLEEVPVSWLVPAQLHAPIRQDAVQLKRSANNRVATGFVQFLGSPVARTLIGQAGYELPGT